ncbi:unnamed protein product [Didymodactylos carnosus]|uniref:NECAP PHear domain-containing protein n=1 Tax=Didymodactylos carnosus TaxID=1234261 RepID=A0A814IMV8_9BILA|nr:unnamed protein product [Didymodactylos carnosus]CAF1057952.1 unnamed protein product [Didymodactylos carnosus]CAF3796872.1 unnamed protein product [Didymodactylos carnosus]CAF3823899.1 unnamed protein product [Didymodactylos carnosus]
MASSSDETYESVGLVKPEVYVYVIPPRQSTTRKHRAADWKLDQPNFICRLKVISKADQCLIRLEDRNTGQHFATCPVESYPSIAVENVEDSTRYFVIRVQNDNGQQAFLGMGFNDRSDSFDFNVALQDHFKYLKQAKQIEQEQKHPEQVTDRQPKLDLSFKEGQTIKINLKSGATGNETERKSAVQKKNVINSGDNNIALLPPPPGSTIPKLTPPPKAPTSVTMPVATEQQPKQEVIPPSTTNNNSNIHSDLSWMQF